MTLVTKKDGRTDKFDPEKIRNAAMKALVEVQTTVEEAERVAQLVTENVTKTMAKRKRVDYNQIHDAVESYLMELNKDAAKAYILYRDKRRQRYSAHKALVKAIEEINKESHKENANMTNSPSTKHAQIASEAAKFYALEYALPADLAAAHKSGDFHIHDLDFRYTTYNCLTYDLGKVLKGGFKMPHGFIREPKSIGAAAALAAVSLQSCQNDQFGGIAIDMIDTHLADFVYDATDREIYQAMEALIYNLNSLHSRAGNQIPFSSVSLGVDTSENARRVCKQFLLAYKAGLGHGENPMFPNIAFKVKEGINFEPGTPNHDLLLLSLEVTSQRMNPTLIFLDTPFNAPYGLNASAMGCRTRVLANRHGEETVTGRGNIASNTINLPRLGIKADKDINKFFELLDGMLHLSERDLIDRWNWVKKLRKKDVPFVFNGVYMNSDHLKEDDCIESSLKNGTLSVGFIGLAETLIALTGKHHGECPEAQELGLRIISHMRAFTDAMSDKYDLNVTLLGSPAEGLAPRFTKLDKKIFGEIKGVTDHTFYTNSSHVPVWHPISIDEKIKIEAPYHKYCNAGHILYIEIPEVPVGNVEGLYRIIQEMRKNDTGYAGFNFPLDFCEGCNYIGVIKDKCAVCGSNSIKRVRRVTGYFSLDTNMNEGKYAELKARVNHSDI